MAQPIRQYVNSRVFKLNVGFLLSAGPSHSHDSEFDFPAIMVADDLILKYLRGPLRLSRTKEGILVQAQLEAAVDTECFRCLESVEQKINLDIEELYAYQSPYKSEFRIGEDAVLDLAPLIRAEALIELSHGVLCKPDCLGLCPECGSNRNNGECTCNLENIDPRLAVLKQLLDPDQV